MQQTVLLKPGLHCPDCGARWSPMAKSAGFVSTSANSEGTSVNNVTLPGNIFRHWQWRPNVRPTSANCPERTNMFVNFGYVGVNRFIGVYRVISGRERKRTQVLRDFSRGTSAIFVNVPRFIVFYWQPHTHERPPTDTRRLGGQSSLFRGGSGVFLHASALFRYVRVYIGSNSAGNRGWVSIPRWFTIYRLTIGLESRLHRVLLSIPGNIGCLPWQKSLSYRYNIAYMWMLPR